jgi:hypothetical protein
MAAERVHSILITWDSALPLIPSSPNMSPIRRQVGIPTSFTATFAYLVSKNNPTFSPGWTAQQQYVTAFQGSEVSNS